MTTSSTRKTRNQGVQTNKSSPQPVTKSDVEKLLKEYLRKMEFTKGSTNVTNKSLKLTASVNTNGTKTVNEKNSYLDFSTKPGNSRARKICIGTLGVVGKTARIVKKPLKCVLGTARWFYKKGVNVCVDNLLDNVQWGFPIPRASGRGIVNIGLCLTLVGGIWQITHGKVTLVEDGVLSTFIVKPTWKIFKLMIKLLKKQSDMLGLTDLVHSLMKQALEIAKDKIGINKMMELITKITSTIGTGLSEAKNIAVDFAKEGVDLVKTAAVKSGAVDFVTPYVSSIGSSMMFLTGKAIAKIKEGVGHQQNKSLMLTNQTNKYIQNALFTNNGRLRNINYNNLIVGNNAAEQFIRNSI